MVLELVVDDDEVVRRLSGRRTCRRCGRVWHVAVRPARAPGAAATTAAASCSSGTTTARRPSGTGSRCTQEQTAPLVAFYADEGILLGIDATGPVEEITERALGALRRFIR